MSGESKLGKLCSARFGSNHALADNDQNGTTGLVLNRRTGYLVGDLAIDSAGFKIQPVHLGGTAPSQVYAMMMWPTFPS